MQNIQNIKKIENAYKKKRNIVKQVIILKNKTAFINLYHDLESNFESLN